ncbi:type 4a pilus biogenesis protein PilO [Chitinispirillales bacterium ANBcel5]|uniref:type 4a pilus biogenesis protein PilO n=1 Tax=Cellulosispirillum alkaliphilum TaxID=3039283 RepID=UPI002A5841D4|nr:type 4a pilus biogenesis protein PilO [Chitinispirillales bacterium ANBcel5]
MPIPNHMHSGFIRKIALHYQLIVIMSAGFFLFCASIHYFAVPQLLALIEKRSKINQLNSYISSSDGFDKIKAEIANTNALLELKLKDLPRVASSRTISDVLDQLINHAKDAGFQLTKIQPGEGNTIGNQIHIPVELEMSTGYNSVGKFVASLETVPQLLRVEQIGTEAQSQDTLLVRLLVTCFIPSQENQ